MCHNQVFSAAINNYQKMADQEGSEFNVAFTIILLGADICVAKA